MMTDVNLAAAPTGTTERIIALDVTRGVAVLGILACNIWAFGFPLQAWRDMGMMGLDHYNRESFIAMMGLLDGTQRGLFSMLFGIGTAVFMDRMANRDAGIRGADLFFRRTFILFMFGLMNAFVFLWIGDILFHYAMVTFIVYVFRNASIKTLLTTVALILAFNMTLKVISYSKAVETKAGWETAMEWQKQKKELTPELTKKMQDWYRRTDTERTKKQVDEQIAGIQSGYIGTWEAHSTWAIRFETTYFYYGFFLDVLIMMLSGIALYRWGIFNADFSRGRLGLMATGLIAAGWAFRYAKITAIWGASFGDLDPIASSFYGIFGQIGRIVLTLGYLSAIIFLCRLGTNGFIKRSLAATGQMALTNYLSQSIICAFIFYGFGFGLYGTLLGYQLYIVVGAIWLAQLIWSPLWLRYYRFGPFEWVWRSLTYGKKQSMKR